MLKSFFVIAALLSASTSFAGVRLSCVQEDQLVQIEIGDVQSGEKEALAVLSIAKITEGSLQKSTAIWGKTFVTVKEVAPKIVLYQSARRTDNANLAYIDHNGEDNQSLMTLRVHSKILTMDLANCQTLSSP